MGSGTGVGNVTTGVGKVVGVRVDAETGLDTGVRAWVTVAVGSGMVAGAGATAAVGSGAAVVASVGGGVDALVGSWARPTIAFGSGMAVGAGIAITVGLGTTVGISVGSGVAAPVGAGVGSATPAGWDLLSAGVVNSVCDVGDGVTTAAGAGSEQATKAGKAKRTVNNNAFTMPGLPPCGCYPPGLQQWPLPLFIYGRNIPVPDRQRQLGPIIARPVHQRGDLVSLHFGGLMRDKDIG